RRRGEARQGPQGEGLGALLLRRLEGGRVRSPLANLLRKAGKARVVSPKLRRECESLTLRPIEQPRIPARRIEPRRGAANAGDPGVQREIAGEGDRQQAIVEAQLRA